MDTLIHADIFFFITTIAVVVVTIGFVVVIWYTIKAVRKCEVWIEKIGGHIEGASEDVQGIVSEIRDSFVFNLLRGKKKKGLLNRIIHKE